MYRRFSVVLFLCVCGAAACAQSLEDLNVQVHGFATQGFLYTTNNNIFGTHSSDGSPNWSEAVVNISVQPVPKLRIAVQPRYELLGVYSNQFSLDYASADYKASDLIGLRFGKVKTPTGLLNETQDIDPSYMWSLLPQGVYPLTNRNGLLSQYGGVVYGTLGIEGSPKLGKLDYRAWGGEVALASNDGYFTAEEEAGVNLPNGLTHTQAGAALHWRAPVRGLMIGVSVAKNNAASGNLTAEGGVLTGQELVAPYYEPDYFALYQRGKFMLAAEYNRLAGNYKVQFTGTTVPYTAFDTRSLFGMGSYKVTEKFSAGLYYSQSFGLTTPIGTPARYSKDWALSCRYDFNQYIYAKAEQHFIDGTSQDYEPSLNPTLQPNTRLTILKIGVSF
jgi:hypothetical protein